MHARMLMDNHFHLLPTARSALAALPMNDER
jgi:hypothetical protein